MGGRHVAPRLAPTHARPRGLDLGAGQPGKVGVHERRNVHAGARAKMMPQREARIDLEQIQPAVGRALEIELGDASQTEPTDQVAPQAREPPLVLADGL